MKVMKAVSKFLVTTLRREPVVTTSCYRHFVAFQYNRLDSFTSNNKTFDERKPRGYAFTDLALKCLRSSAYGSYHLHKIEHRTLLHWFSKLCIYIEVLESKRKLSIVNYYDK